MGLLSRKNDSEIVTLLTNHQSAILSFIHTMMPGNPAADDVLQRTNMVIWKKRAKFQLGTNFKSWAFSIAHWEVRAHIKEAKRKDWLVFDDELSSLLNTTLQEETDETKFSDLSIHLEGCIRKLREQDQSLLHHHYFSDKPLKDYANACGRPVTSLKTTLGRIRIALRKCLDSQSKLQTLNHPSNGHI